MIESRCGTQEQAIIDRAGALINSKTDYIGDGMEGWAVMTLMDENGYPTSSTMTISKADGIRWLSFLSTTTGAKADRIALSNKACICLASSEYHVSLTGTIEIITDPAIKKDHWQDTIIKYHGVTYQDPSWAVYRFTTETYNLYFASDDTEAKGKLIKNNGGLPWQKLNRF
ncbi:MAG: pyridoxamine 5'-phosphate oxidase family protein [Defluviitaleaceae bacterium]|nr:pyridoxamine 5'-phosphate oxidase family protein [Defluviitaleaceae bacterium]